MASKIRGAGEVVLVYFGDGATSEGDFHVACNFAGVFEAPVVFLCRNNQWAISVPLRSQTASPSIASKAQSYGIEGVQVDGNDLLAVYQVTLAAVEKARRGEGPTLVEALTYRQGAHSTSDDPRAYREEGEVEPWIKRDPLLRFRNFLTKRDLWNEGAEEQAQEEIRGAIQSAISKSEGLSHPDLSSLVEDVFYAVPWHLEEQRAEILEVEGQGKA
jgi:TPP-dependent pyruvate/acetoin dehydrogenase alpha subunit